MSENQENQTIVCGREELHEYKFDEILGTQQDHETRIKALEDNKIEMRTEFANLKRDMADTKYTMLDLDRKNSEKWEKMFNKVLDSLDKRESNRFEMTKTKFGLLIAIVTTISTLGAIILPHFFK